MAFTLAGGVFDYVLVIHLTAARGPEKSLRHIPTTTSRDDYVSKRGSQIQVAQSEIFMLVFFTSKWTWGRSAKIPICSVSRTRPVNLWRINKGTAVGFTYQDKAMSKG